MLQTDFDSLFTFLSIIINLNKKLTFVDCYKNRYSKKN